MANENEKKNSHLTWWLVGAATLVAASLLVKSLRLNTAHMSMDGSQDPLIGKPAPNIEYELPPGTPTSLTQNRGKAILVNFWASWCEPCMEEMQSLVALEQHFAGKPFLLLAFNVDEDRASVEAFLAGRTMPRNLIFDYEKAFLDPYEVSSIPFSVLIDRKGNVQSAFLGPREWNRAEVFEDVETALH